MTLLITVFAAIFSTILWYVNEKARFIKIGILCYEFWGASLMWFVDAVYEYLEFREAYFSPSRQDMLNDTFLGLSVIALGLIIWLIILLLKDPKHVIKK